jgi:hypothetical protein
MLSPHFRHDFDAVGHKSRHPRDRIFSHVFRRGVIRHSGDNPGIFQMTRPVLEAHDKTQALQKGFRTSARGALAARHARAYVTLLMASGLILATIAVVTVSIEVVKAAALH